MTGLLIEHNIGTIALIVLAVPILMAVTEDGLDWAKKKGYSIPVVCGATADLDRMIYA